MRSDRFGRMPTSRALSIFFTAGFPRRDDTMPILQQLEAAGVDMVEVGFPFSDPVADGPTIQASSQRALSNGMSLELLFRQLQGMRASVSIPVLLMGYLNPVEQYGFERFITDAAQCGIDGVIIPDMPFEEYLERYKPLFDRSGVRPVFLITSRTEPDRIRALDRENPAFLYVLSSDAVTGGAVSVSSDRDAFFKRLADMGLSSRLVVGFGVSDKTSFDAVTRHTSGAIVGSAFVKVLASLLESRGNPHETDLQRGTVLSNFVRQLR
jgi:tryptophan synthase alpha chain